MGTNQTEETLLIETKSVEQSNSYFLQKIKSRSSQFQRNPPTFKDSPNIPKFWLSNSKTKSSRTIKGEEFHQNGSIKAIGEYDHKGRRHGYFKIYAMCKVGYRHRVHPNKYFLGQKLLYEAEFKNGKKDGKCIIYRSNHPIEFLDATPEEQESSIAKAPGSVCLDIRIQIFTEGKETGPFKIILKKYGANEQQYINVLKFGQVINSKITGQFKCYENGKLVKQSYYARNPQDFNIDIPDDDEGFQYNAYEPENKSNLTMTYFSNGEVHKLKDYRENELIGNAHYFTNGQIKLILTNKQYVYCSLNPFYHIEFIGSEMLTSYNETRCFSVGKTFDKNGRQIFQGRSVGKTSKPFGPSDGILKDYYEKIQGGGLKFCTELKDFVPVAPVKYYGQNGKMLKIGYGTIQLHGNSYDFDYDSKKFGIGYYVHGQVESQMIPNFKFKFSERGFPIIKGSALGYLQNGDNIIHFNEETGVLNSQGSFKNNKKDGVFIIWNQTKNSGAFKSELETWEMGILKKTDYAQKKKVNVPLIDGHSEEVLQKRKLEFQKQKNLRQKYSGKSLENQRRNELQRQKEEAERTKLEHDRAALELEFQLSKEVEDLNNIFANQKNRLISVLETNPESIEGCEWYKGQLDVKHKEIVEEKDEGDSRATSNKSKKSPVIKTINGFANFDHNKINQDFECSSTDRYISEILRQKSIHQSPIKKSRQSSPQKKKLKKKSKKKTPYNMSDKYNVPRTRRVMPIKGAEGTSISVSNLKKNVKDQQRSTSSIMIKGSKKTQKQNYEPLANKAEDRYINYENYNSNPIVMDEATPEPVIVEKSKSVAPYKGAYLRHDVIDKTIEFGISAMRNCKKSNSPKRIYPTFRTMNKRDEKYQSQCKSEIDPVKEISVSPSRAKKMGTQRILSQSRLSNCNVVGQGSLNTKHIRSSTELPKWAESGYGKSDNIVSLDNYSDMRLTSEESRLMLRQDQDKQKKFDKLESLQNFNHRFVNMMKSKNDTTIENAPQSMDTADQKSSNMRTNDHIAKSTAFHKKSQSKSIIQPEMIPKSKISNLTKTQNNIINDSQDRYNQPRQRPKAENIFQNSSNQLAGRVHTCRRPKTSKHTNETYPNGAITTKTICTNKIPKSTISCKFNSTKPKNYNEPISNLESMYSSKNDKSEPNIEEPRLYPITKHSESAMGLGRSQLTLETSTEENLNRYIGMSSLDKKNSLEHFVTPRSVNGEISLFKQFNTSILTPYSTDYKILEASKEKSPEKIVIKQESPKKAKIDNSDLVAAHKLYVQQLLKEGLNNGYSERSFNIDKAKTEDNDSQKADQQSNLEVNIQTNDLNIQQADYPKTINPKMPTKESLEEDSETEKNKEQVFVGFWDGSIRKLDITKLSYFTNPRPKKQEQCGKDCITNMIATSEFLFITDYSGCMTQWDISSGKLHHNWGTIHSDIITSIAITHDEKFIFTSSIYDSIKQWNLSSRQLIHTYQDPILEGSIGKMVISSNGKWLFTGGSSSVKKINIKTKCIAQEYGKNDGIKSNINCFVVNAKLLFISWSIGYLLAMDYESDKVVHCLGKIHQSKINCMVLSPDGKTLFTSDDGGVSTGGLVTGAVMCQWDILKWKLVKNWGVIHQTTVKSQAVLRGTERDYIITGGYDCFQKIWNIKTSDLISEVQFEGINWQCQRVCSAIAVRYDPIESNWNGKIQLRSGKYWNKNFVNNKSNNANVLGETKKNLEAKKPIDVNSKNKPVVSKTAGAFDRNKEKVIVENKRDLTNNKKKEPLGDKTNLVVLPSKQTGVILIKKDIKDNKSVSNVKQDSIKPSELQVQQVQLEKSPYKKKSPQSKINRKLTNNNKSLAISVKAKDDTVNLVPIVTAAIQNNKSVPKFSIITNQTHNKSPISKAKEANQKSPEPWTKTPKHIPKITKTSSNKKLFITNKFSPQKKDITTDNIRANDSRNETTIPYQKRTSKSVINVKERCNNIMKTMVTKRQGLQQQQNSSDPQLQVQSVSPDIKDSQERRKRNLSAINFRSDKDSCQQKLLDRVHSNMIKNTTHKGLQDNSQNTEEQIEKKPLISINRIKDIASRFMKTQQYITKISDTAEKNEENSEKDNKSLKSQTKSINEQNETPDRTACLTKMGKYSVEKSAAMHIKVDLDIMSRSDSTEKGKKYKYGSANGKKDQLKIEVNNFKSSNSKIKDVSNNKIKDITNSKMKDIINNRMKDISDNKIKDTRKVEESPLSAQIKRMFTHQSKESSVEKSAENSFKNDKSLTFDNLTIDKNTMKQNEMSKDSEFEESNEKDRMISIQSPIVYEKNISIKEPCYDESHRVSQDNVEEDHQTDDDQYDEISDEVEDSHQVEYSDKNETEVADDRLELLLELSPQTQVHHNNEGEISTNVNFEDTTLTLTKTPLENDLLIVPAPPSQAGPQFLEKIKSDFLNRVSSKKYNQNDFKQKISNSSIRTLDELEASNSDKLLEKLSSGNEIDATEEINPKKKFEDNLKKENCSKKEDQDEIEEEVNVMDNCAEYKTPESKPDSIKSYKCIDDDNNVECGDCIIDKIDFSNAKNNKIDKDKKLFPILNGQSNNSVINSIDQYQEKQKSVNSSSKTNPNTRNSTISIQQDKNKQLYPILTENDKKLYPNCQSRDFFTTPNIINQQQGNIADNEDNGDEELPIRGSIDQSLLKPRKEAEILYSEFDKLINDPTNDNKENIQTTRFTKSSDIPLQPSLVGVPPENYNKDATPTRESNIDIEDATNEDINLTGPKLDEENIACKFSENSPTDIRIYHSGEKNHELTDEQDIQKTPNEKRYRSEPGKDNAETIDHILFISKSQKKRNRYDVIDDEDDVEERFEQRGYLGEKQIVQVVENSEREVLNLFKKIESPIKISKQEIKDSLTSLANHDYEIEAVSENVDAVENFDE